MSLIHSVQDKSDFDTQLKDAGNKLVVVDFYATWCGPCKMVAPKLEEMAALFTDVIFLKVDVDENEEVASEYGISCMPTFIFIKNGEKVSEFSGANADKIKELIGTNK
ncbi:thioredoxin-2 [Folsomia candida]|nr:thioredoxin-2 [Folsomia candida]